MAANGALPEGLLADIKNYLNITWEDTSTNSKISDMIRDGIAYLDKRRGAAADYTAPGAPRMLLKEYVRYARDGALDVFENNYLHEIVSMQNERAVDLYGAENPV